MCVRACVHVCLRALCSQVTEQAALSKVQGLQDTITSLERSQDELRAQCAGLQQAVEAHRDINKQLMLKKEEVEWQLMAAKAKVRTGVCVCVCALDMGHCVQKIHVRTGLSCFLVTHGAWRSACSIGSVHVQTQRKEDEALKGCVCVCNAADARVPIRAPSRAQARHHHRPDTHSRHTHSRLPAVALSRRPCAQRHRTHAQYTQPQHHTPCSDCVDQLAHCVYKQQNDGGRGSAQAYSKGEIRVYLNH